jgi:hypothetical protein
MEDKQYIGDGIYAWVNPMSGMLELTTEDGVNVTNIIYFEPSTLKTFLAYAERVLSVN